MRTVVIVGLGVVLLAIIIGALTVPRLLNGEFVSREAADAGPVEGAARLRIAIATGTTLQALVNSQQANQDCEDDLAAARREAEQVRDEGGDAGGDEAEADAAGTPAARTPSSPIDRITGSICVQRMLYRMLIDGFEGQLSGALANSERFDVAEPSSVLAAFREMAQTEVRRPAEDVEEPRGGLRQLFGWGSNADPPEPAEMVERVIEFAQTDAAAAAADFSEIAQELEVRYFLFVDLGRPQFYSDVVTRAYEDGTTWVIRANPNFTFRLYDVDKKRIVYSAREQLEGGLAIDVMKTAFGRLLEADVTNTGILQNAYRSILADVDFERLRDVSHRVAQAVLDAVSPAVIASPDQIVHGDVVVITRGSNDGVRLGDEFDVLQVKRDAYNEPIRVVDPATGVVLSSPTEVVGRIRVTEVSANSNVATARRIDGSQTLFQRGDKLAAVSARPGTVDTPAARGGQGAASPGGRARLGVQTAEADTALVAVSEFDVLGVQDTRTAAQLQELVARSLTRRLSGDRRYRVVTRRDLDRIQEEYDLGLEVRGEIPAGQRANVAIAGYIVSGVVEITDEEVKRSISLRGQTQQLPSRFNLRASGEVSIMDSSSVIVAAEQVRVSKRVARTDLGEAGPLGNLADEFSATAAQLLRNTLYPLKVVQVQTDAGRFVINGGEDAGLGVGTRLDAYNLGEPVIDIDTGLELSPGARTLIGTLEVIDVDGQTSTARTVSLEGELKRGDVVEISASQAPPTRAASAPAPPAAPRREEEDTEVPF